MRSTGMLQQGVTLRCSSPLKVSLCASPADASMGPLLLWRRLARQPTPLSGNVSSPHQSFLVAHRPLCQPRCLLLLQHPAF